MRLARLIGLLLIVSGVLVLVAATTAHAAEGRIVSSSRVDDNRVGFVFTADGLAEGVSIDASSAQVTTDDGIELPTEGATYGEGGTATPPRTAVLVMDVSSSMEGPRLDEAKNAALAFLDKVPADVDIGLVTFASQAVPVVPPTANRDDIRSEIQDLQTSVGTALYDGVIAGVNMAAAPGGIASVLLLADGDDSGEGASLEAAEDAVEVSGVQVNAVAIGDADLRSLTAITDAGEGALVASSEDVTELTAIFEQAADAIAKEIIVSAEIIREVAGREVTLVVSAMAGDETISDQRIADLSDFAVDPTQAADVYGAQPVPNDSFVPTTWLLAGLGALFLGLAPLLGVALARATSSVSMQGKVRRRLSVYTLSGRKPVKREETTVSQAPIARQAVGLADRIVRERDFESLLAARLDSAGLSLRPAEWLLIHVGVALGSGLLLLLLSGLQLVPAMLGMLLGVAGPFIFLLVKASRRRSAFLAQLPETLQLMAGSLSAGYSLPQAVDTVVRDGSPPMSTELNRALVESRLGVPIEDALDGVADRMVSKDFAWVIMAIRIQRQVGGNLAELLTTVAATLRERERLRRQVHALSAEGRLSAWILGALPIGFALYLIVARGSYLQPLWSDPLGWSLLLLGAVLMVGGALWLRKVVRVEV
jgi:tight adherence protein B